MRTDGAVYRGRYAIVAVPPLLAGRIHYTGGLPAKRDQLTARMPMGSIIKYVAAYERPFWREAGFSGLGEVVDDGNTSAFVGVPLTTYAWEAGVESIAGAQPGASHAALIETTELCRADGLHGSSSSFEIQGPRLLEGSKARGRR